MRVNSLQLHDFAALAKRLSAWTTNSLFTLLVLVVGVGFGRQMTNWWAADASPPPVVAAGLDNPAQVRMLQFGDASWSLCRRWSWATSQRRSNNCGLPAAKSSWQDRPSISRRRTIAFSNSSPVARRRSRAWQMEAL